MPMNQISRGMSRSTPSPQKWRYSADGTRRPSSTRGPAFLLGVELAAATQNPSSPTPASAAKSSEKGPSSVIAATPLRSSQLKQRRGSLANSFSAPVDEDEVRPTTSTVGITYDSTPAEGAEDYWAGCRAAAAKDSEAAGRAWMAAAAQGHRSAQRRLGFAHLAGAGVEQSNEEASFYFGQAAAQGDLVAKTALGSLYALGKQPNSDDGAPDFAAAAALWAEASKGGDDLASLKHATLLFEGVPEARLPAQPLRAVQWLAAWAELDVGTSDDNSSGGGAGYSARAAAGAHHAAAAAVAAGHPLGSGRGGDGRTLAQLLLGCAAEGGHLPLPQGNDSSGGAAGGGTAAGSSRRGSSSVGVGSRSRRSSFDAESGAVVVDELGQGTRDLVLARRCFSAAHLAGHPDAKHRMNALAAAVSRVRHATVRASAVHSFEEAAASWDTGGDKAGDSSTAADAVEKSSSSSGGSTVLPKESDLHYGDSSSSSSTHRTDSFVSPLEGVESTPPRRQTPGAVSLDWSLRPASRLRAAPPPLSFAKDLAARAESQNSRSSSGGTVRAGSAISSSSSASAASSSGFTSRPARSSNSSSIGAGSSGRSGRSSGRSSNEGNLSRRDSFEQHALLELQTTTEELAGSYSSNSSSHSSANWSHSSHNGSPLTPRGFTVAGPRFDAWSSAERDHSNSTTSANRSTTSRRPNPSRRKRPSLHSPLAPSSEVSWSSGASSSNSNSSSSSSAHASVGGDDYSGNGDPNSYHKLECFTMDELQDEMVRFRRIVSHEEEEDKQDLPTERAEKDAADENEGENDANEDGDDSDDDADDDSDEEIDEEAAGVQRFLAQPDVREYLLAVRALGVSALDAAAQITCRRYRTPAQIKADEREALAREALVKDVKEDGNEEDEREGVDEKESENGDDDDVDSTAEAVEESDETESNEVVEEKSDHQGGEEVDVKAAQTTSSLHATTVDDASSSSEEKEEGNGGVGEEETALEEDSINNSNRSSDSESRGTSPNRPPPSFVFSAETSEYAGSQSMKRISDGRAAKKLSEESGSDLDDTSDSEAEDNNDEDEQEENQQRGGGAAALDWTTAAAALGVAEPPSTGDTPDSKVDNDYHEHHSKSSSSNNHNTQSPPSRSAISASKTARSGSFLNRIVAKPSTIPRKAASTRPTVTPSKHASSSSSLTPPAPSLQRTPISNKISSLRRGVNPSRNEGITPSRRRASSAQKYAVTPVDNRASSSTSTNITSSSKPANRPVTPSRPSQGNRNNSSRREAESNPAATATSDTPSRSASSLKASNSNWRSPRPQSPSTSSNKANSASLGRDNSTSRSQSRNHSRSDSRSHSRSHSRSQSSRSSSSCRTPLPAEPHEAFEALRHDLSRGLLSAHSNPAHFFAFLATPLSSARSDVADGARSSSSSLTTAAAAAPQQRSLSRCRSRSMLDSKDHYDRKCSSSRSRSNARASSSAAVTPAAQTGNSGASPTSREATTFGASEFARGCKHFTNYDIKAGGSDLAVQQLLVFLKGEGESSKNNTSDGELRVSLNELEANWSKLVNEDTSSVTSSSSPRPPLRPHSPPLLQGLPRKGNNSDSLSSKRSSLKHRKEVSSPKLPSQTQQAPTGEEDVLSLLASSSAAAVDSKELAGSTEGSSCGTSDNEGSINGGGDADNDDDDDGKTSDGEEIEPRTSHVTPLALSFK